jgi:putative FmdB family regulatory protein
MPTYGYQCTACGNGFEVVQKMSDAALTTCDLCGGELRKKIFPVGIAFKGSGFYVNDYANKGGAVKPESKAPDSDAAPKTEGAVTPAASSESAAPTTSLSSATPDSKPAAATTTSAAKAGA